MPGDMDFDGDVDMDDIEGFVQGLRDASAYEERRGVPPSANGDMDGDLDFDYDDIPGFALLFNAATAAGDVTSRSQGPNAEEFDTSPVGAAGIDRAPQPAETIGPDQSSDATASLSVPSRVADVVQDRLSRSPSPGEWMQPPRDRPESNSDHREPAGAHRVRDEVSHRTDPLRQG